MFVYLIPLWRCYPQDLNNDLNFFLRFRLKLFKMKPGSMGHSNTNTRRSKSLCGRFEMLGKKGTEERKSLFKAPPGVAKVTQSYLNPSRGIPKPVKSGLTNKRSSHAFKGIIKKNDTANSKFLRPEIDVLAARKRMLERTLHLKQNSGNEVEDGNLDFKDINIMQKLNLPQTPKQSALTKVYLKLTESAKKAAKSRSLFSEVSTSHLTAGEILHGKSNLNSTGIANNSYNFTAEVQSGKPLIQCNSELVKSKGYLFVTPESTKDITVSAPDFSSRENRKSSRNHALNNILKYCQLYSTKVSSLIDAITCLDDSFQSVIAGEVGGHVYSNFCEYQKKKLNLYREIRVIEEELEDAVRNEIDLQNKFKNYLRKKVNIWKEESDLLEEFKSTISAIIDKYEEEVPKPPDPNCLHELVQMFSPSTINEKDVDAEELVLRRSQRLLTPKRTQTNEKCCRVLRSNSGKKDVKQSDDLIIQRNAKSNRKRSIQRSIYKDLQKSFNLYSPECSF